MEGLSTGRQRRSRFAKGRVACVVLLVGTMLAMCAFEKSMSLEWGRENPPLVGDDDVFEPPGVNNSGLSREQSNATNLANWRAPRRARSTSASKEKSPSPPHSPKGGRQSTSRRRPRSSSAGSSSSSRWGSSSSSRSGSSSSSRSRSRSRSRSGSRSRRRSSGSDVAVFGPRWKMPLAGSLRRASTAAAAAGGGNTGGETTHKPRPIVWSPYGARPEGTRLYQLNDLNGFDYIPCDLSREQSDIQGDCLASWLELSGKYKEREMITQLPWDTHNTILRKLEQWLPLRQPNVILTNCLRPTVLDVDYQCMGNTTVMAKSKALLEEGGKSYVRDVSWGVAVYSDDDGALLHRCYLDVTVKFNRGVELHAQDVGIAAQMGLIHTAGWKLWNGGRKGVFLLPFEVDEEELKTSNSLSLEDPERGIFKIEKTSVRVLGERQQFPCGNNSRQLSLGKGVTITVLAVRRAAPFLATPPKVAKDVIHVHIEPTDDAPVNMNPQGASKRFIEDGLSRHIQLHYLKLKGVDPKAMKGEVNDMAFHLSFCDDGALRKEPTYFNFSEYPRGAVSPWGAVSPLSPREAVRDYTFFVSSPTPMYTQVFARQFMMYVYGLTFERVAELFRFLITPHTKPDDEAATTRDEKNTLQLPTPNIAVWLSYPKVPSAGVLYSDVENKGGCLYRLRIKFRTDQYELQLKAATDKRSRIRLQPAMFAEVVLDFSVIYVFEWSTKDEEQEPATVMMPSNGTVTLRRKMEGAEAPTITCGAFPVTFNDPTDIEMRLLPLDVRTNHKAISKIYNSAPQKYPADSVAVDARSLVGRT